MEDKDIESSVADIFFSVVKTIILMIAGVILPTLPGFAFMYLTGQAGPIDLTEEVLWFLAGYLGFLGVVIWIGIRWEADNTDLHLATLTSRITRRSSVRNRHQEDFDLDFPVESYPDNWIEISQNVRRRDEYRCANCGATNEELHVHHIVPLSRGGTNQLGNLKTLCKSCHARIHPHMKD